MLLNMSVDKKALNIHSCDVCLNFSKNSEEIEDCLLLTHFKAYQTDKSIYGGLRIPNKEFIFFIYELEKIFTAKFYEFVGSTEISHKYFQEMKNRTFIHPCSMFPTLYVIKLFIRLNFFIVLNISIEKFELIRTRNTEKLLFYHMSKINISF